VWNIVRNLRSLRKEIAIIIVDHNSIWRWHYPTPRWRWSAAGVLTKGVQGMRDDLDLRRRCSAMRAL